MHDRTALLHGRRYHYTERGFTAAFLAAAGVATAGAGLALVRRR
jgi:hypothetical protein